MVVGLSSDLISGILDLFLHYKNLLGNLHKNDKGIPCKKQIIIFLKIYLKKKKKGHDG